MREIALHILDVAENGIDAGADRIDIRVEEAVSENRLTVTIQDNGKGIPSDMIQRVTDPFVTSRKTRRVGMGLSLLKSAAERCEGGFEIVSQAGKGTRITAFFRHDHIVRAPLGDMAGSIALLIAGHPEVTFGYRYVVGENRFELDTSDIKKELGDVPIQTPSVINYLKAYIAESMDEIQGRKA